MMVRGQETNIAQGKAKCHIKLKTHSVLHSQQFFPNWFNVFALCLWIEKVILRATEWKPESKRYIISYNQTCLSTLD